MTDCRSLDLASAGCLSRSTQRNIMPCSPEVLLRVEAGVGVPNGSSCLVGAFRAFHDVVCGNRLGSHEIGNVVLENVKFLLHSSVPILGDRWAHCISVGVGHRH